MEVQNHLSTTCTYHLQHPRHNSLRFGVGLLYSVPQVRSPERGARLHLISTTTWNQVIIRWLESH